GDVMRFEGAKERDAVVAERLEMAFEDLGDDAGVAFLDLSRDHVEKGGIVIAKDAHGGIEGYESLQGLFCMRVVADGVTKEDGGVVTALRGVQENGVQGRQIGVNVADEQVAHVAARISRVTTGGERREATSTAILRLMHCPRRRTINWLSVLAVVAMLSAFTTAAAQL